MKKTLFLLVAVYLLVNNCIAQKIKEDKNKGLIMATKMADSEMKHFPDPVTVDFNPKPVWNYTQGLIAHSMINLWKVSGNEAYYSYAKKYADRFIDSTGAIYGYKIEEYNIDCINSGKFLFDVYDRTKDNRYLKAITFLRDQLKLNISVKVYHRFRSKVYHPKRDQFVM